MSRLLNRDEACCCVQVRAQAQRRACCWHCWRSLQAAAQRAARLLPPAAWQHLRRVMQRGLQGQLEAHARVLWQRHLQQGAMLNTLQSVRRQLRQRRELAALLLQAQARACKLAAKQRRQALPRRQTAELQPTLHAQPLAHPPLSTGLSWTQGRRQKRRRLHMRPLQTGRPLQARHAAGRLLPLWPPHTPVQPLGV